MSGMQRMCVASLENCADSNLSSYCLGWTLAVHVLHVRISFELQFYMNYKSHCSIHGQVHLHCCRLVPIAVHWFCNCVDWHLKKSISWLILILILANASCSVCTFRDIVVHSVKLQQILWYLSKLIQWCRSKHELYLKGYSICITSCMVQRSAAPSSLQINRFGNLYWCERLKMRLLNPTVCCDAICWTSKCADLADVRVITYPNVKCLAVLTGMLTWKFWCFRNMLAHLES